MSLGIKPTVDFAFKKIFGSPEGTRALIGLLNAILALPQPITEVTVRNPFNYQDFVDDKLIVLDIRAVDSTGRWLNIEMQVSVVSGLVQRLVYYACSLYVDQLVAGQNYATLRPAISICLLSKVFFHDAIAAHHRFRLCDPDHERELRESIEVHTVELTKYNLQEATISQASKLEQWAFFLLYADQYEPEHLRRLLPALEFQEAIAAIERIAHKTEDRIMYDQREKAERDRQWLLEGSRAEGLEQGLEQGLVQGLVQGLERGRQEGRIVGLEEGAEKGALAGQVRLLQELLGADAMSLSELLRFENAQLSEMLEELQRQLRSRNA